VTPPHDDAADTISRSPHADRVELDPDVRMNRKDVKRHPLCPPQRIGPTVEQVYELVKGFGAEGVAPAIDATLSN
jgi:hypothetical protein